MQEIASKAKVLEPSALSRLDFWVGRSLRCQAVVSQPHGSHRLATVATLMRAAV